VWLTSAPKFLFKTRVGVYFELTSTTAPQLAGVLRPAREARSERALLWDGNRGDPDATRMPPSAALRLLDGAITTGSVSAFGSGPSASSACARRRRRTVPSPASPVR
jgi:hypothetical protein